MNAALGDVFSSKIRMTMSCVFWLTSANEKCSASYFAFTLLPESTLERFGEANDGTFKPFHLYSMRQAIEEGFILDVLNNYTRYQSYYRFRSPLTTIPVRFNRAQRKLKAFVSNPKTIAAKQS